jgi:hypothetical protein
MSRPRIRNRWKSKFARFVLDFGTTALSEELEVHQSAIYHWIRGATTPRPWHAATLQRLASERGVGPTLDQIYQHSRQFRSGRRLEAKSDRLGTCEQPPRSPADVYRSRPSRSVAPQSLDC